MANANELEDCVQHEQLLYFLELQEEYESWRTKPTDAELLQIFPEIKIDLPDIIKDRERAKKNLANKIRNRLKELKRFSKNDYWFGRECLKQNEVKQLLKIKKQIARLKSLVWLSQGKIPKNHLTDQQIRFAKEVPISQLFAGRLRRRGKTLLGICPFHSEKHPSFTIYSEQNSWYCFGCSQGGSVIDYVMTLHGLTFKEAINYLT